MPPDLHLDPARLHAHASRTEDLADRLRGLRGPDVEALLWAGRELAEQTEELVTAVARAARNLDDLSSALRSAAAGTEAVDRDVEHQLLRAGWDAP
ncbi:MAG: hypothetical protein H0X35_13420 [Pseudonocardiales bacterium]|nr:hypothetical protein [Pseudonocardiales bacterium]